MFHLSFDGAQNDLEDTLSIQDIEARPRPMAYMRGSFYLWQDGANVHIWSRNGYDGWDESVWNQPDDSIVGGDNPASGIANARFTDGKATGGATV